MHLRTPFIVLACLLFSQLHAENARRPNIVVLIADDWGFSDVGAYGGEISTPTLNGLARQGQKFSNFHVSASCSPTRAMLLTGVDNHRNGVGNMRETIPQEHLGKSGYLTVLNQNVVTVSSLLKDGGYHTYAVGKWHVGQEAHNLPNQRGFERSLVQGDSGSDNWETSKRYLDLTEKVNWYEDGKEAVMPSEYYSSEYFVDKAIEYINSGVGDRKPFFAYVAFQANHIPIQAPREFIQRYQGRYKEGWEALRLSRQRSAIEQGMVPLDSPMVKMSTTLDWNKLSQKEKDYQSRRMEVYAGMAEAMDHHIGRLVSHLKKMGQFDNTVFVFLSDNGAEASDPYATLSGSLWLATQYNKDIDRLGAKGAYSLLGPSWASAAASPLSTYKFYAGEGGIRVPLIISGVKGMQQNKVQPSFTHVKDIAPTLLKLAQIPLPQNTYHGQKIENMTGLNLLPVLLGKSSRTHPEGESIGYELSGNQAVFRGDLKLVKNLPPVGDGQWHLFDIAKDPGETKDLQTLLPRDFELLQKEYERYALANDVQPMPKGYEPINQIVKNALINVYVPRFQLPVIVFLMLTTCLWGVIWLRKRKSKISNQQDIHDHRTL